MAMFAPEVAMGDLTELAINGRDELIDSGSHTCFATAKSRRLDH